MDWYSTAIKYLFFISTLVLADDSIAADTVFPVTFDSAPTPKTSPGNRQRLLTAAPAPRPQNSIPARQPQQKPLTARPAFGPPVTVSPVPAPLPAVEAKRQPNDQTAEPVARADRVTLKSAVTMALRWHPEIKRAAEELAQMKETVSEARAGYFPNLSSRIRSGFEGQERDKRSSSMELIASQLLYDFGKTGNKVKLASAGANRAALMLAKSINTIIYETTHSYLQTLRFQKLEQIARRQTAGFSAINQIASKRADLGASAESDYSQSRVRLASSLSLLHDYEAQANRWAATLDNLTNTPVAARLADSPSGAMKNVCRNVDIQRLHSPDIEIARAQIDIAKSQIAEQKANYFPTITLNPGYEYSLENSDRDHNDRDGKFNVFVNVAVPLFEGGARLSRTRQAEQALSAAQYNLDKDISDARRKITEASSQIISLELSLDAKQQREKDAVRTRDLYKMQYLELGTRQFSDLLNAESEIHQTRMDIINSQFTFQMLTLDCLYYSGHLASFFNN
ncbi:TolC family outer membrane protein [Entomohabitans teleogrylli]|uniref:TolC family outer membrane protein n=1 Tax=Entomohabitans teleogrylli TaxID=1384589 RepID=UPI0009EAD4CA|nr:TolC family outer membrane protein [Entomohabitans teleogrylli]